LDAPEGTDFADDEELVVVTEVTPVEPQAASDNATAPQVNPNMR